MHVFVKIGLKNMLLFTALPPFPFCLQVFDVIPGSLAVAAVIAPAASAEREQLGARKTKLCTATSGSGVVVFFVFKHLPVSRQ